MSKTPDAIKAMTTHLYDDRRTVISPYSIGNAKIGTGPGIYTYSRRPGKVTGTCPGATGYCLSVCYAMRVEDNKPVWDLWGENGGDVVPPVPDDARLVRWHVSGDFDTVRYIENWVYAVRHAPAETVCFGYTRSWRVPELVPYLDRLRAQPGVTLFASVDPGTPEAEKKRLREDGWRLSHILPNDEWEERHESSDWWQEGRYVVGEGLKLPLTTVLVCPEQRGTKPDCATCGFCFNAQRGDVAFIEH